MEIFDSQLLGEGVLPTMRDAASRLLKVQTMSQELLQLFTDCLRSGCMTYTCTHMCLQSASSAAACTAGG